MSDILNLLPQSREMVLETPKMQIYMLELLDFMVKETVRALRAFFVEKAFYKFDPHVGETSCHIRALQVLHWHERLQQRYSAAVVNDYITQLEQISSVLLTALSSISLQKQRFRRSTFSELLNQHELNLALPAELLLLTQMFFLSQYKFFDANEATYLDLNKIRRTMNISLWMAKRLVRNFQLNIAEKSCKFVESLAKKMDFDESFVEVLLALKKEDDGNRQVLPYFLTMKVLLRYLAKRDKLIMFVIHRTLKNRGSLDHFALLFSYNGQDFVPITDKFHLFSKKPVFVIKGQVEYAAKVESKKAFKARLLKAGIMNVILASTAVHPQYSGKMLAQYQDNPYEGLAIEREFLIAKEMGRALGCAKDSAELFCPIHILCDSVSHQLQALERFVSVKEKIKHLFLRSKSAALT